MEAASRRPKTAGALRRSLHDRRLGAKNRAERGWLHPNGDHGGTGSPGATDLLGRVGGVSDLGRRITAILESSEP